MLVEEDRRTPLSSIHAWVVDHDDSRLFVIGYISLALVLSVVIGLFWLFALLMVHLAFEVVRMRHAGHGWPDATLRATWAVRLDIALFLFALVLALHLQFVFGVLGLQAAGRAGMAAQAGLRGARFAAWEKVIRGVLLSADDAVQGARGVAAMRRRSVATAAGGAIVQASAAGGHIGASAPGGAIVGASAVPAEQAPPEVRPAAEGPAVNADAPTASGPLPARWGIGDYFTMTLAGACVLLILVAPWLGHESWTAVVEVLTAELRPFPVR